jgi:hypothetical protein
MRLSSCFVLEVARLGSAALMMAPMVAAML